MALNVAAITLLLCLLGFLPYSSPINISVFYFPGSVQYPRLEALQEARAAQAAFCTGIDPNRLPRQIEVPWIPGATEEQLRKVNSTTQLVLRQGLRSKVAGLSPTVSQYIFAADDIVSGHVMVNGEWETGELAAIIRKLQLFAASHKLRPKDVWFVDVGANVGVYTLFVAAYGFNVLAFEPLHVNVMALRHSLCANPLLMQRITLLTQALGNETQRCGIWTLPTNLGDGTVVCNQAGLVPGLIKRQDLEISRLDDVLTGALGALTGRVGAMKVDVEGHELAVVDGGARYMEAVRPAYVMMEVNDGMMFGATGQTSAALFTRMWQHGYQVHQGSFEGAVIQPSLFSGWKEEKITNYYFTRTGALAGGRQLYSLPNS